MKRANRYYKSVLAGILTEGDDGYEFHYLPEYLTSDKAKSVSLTMSLREEVYRSNVLFPFFDGLGHYSSGGVALNYIFYLTLFAVIFMMEAFPVNGGCENNLCRNKLVRLKINENNP